MNDFQRTPEAALRGPSRSRSLVRTCKGCGGQAGLIDGSQNPAGWNGLTAFVPPHITTASGRSYVWVGLYCSVGCLAADMMNLRFQEELAHQAYEPVRADRPHGRKAAG